ncbi:MAG: aldose epimerase family protein [Clostridia bacterium]
MSIKRKLFGITKTGKEVFSYCLSNENGIAITVIDYGCTITSIIVPDKSSQLVDICLGYDKLEDYENGQLYLGAVIGRHANRIASGKLIIEDKNYPVAINNPPNHSHGGIQGFDKHLWQAEIVDHTLVFTRISPHLEEGYPGNLTVTISYHLNFENQLKISYLAISDQTTVVNLTNHSYFNLHGHHNGDALSQSLQIFANSYAPIDRSGLPLGIILPVNNTPFDFRQTKTVGRDIFVIDEQLARGNGYDHYYLLADNNKVKHAASLYSCLTGIHMDIETTNPGMQFYSGNFLTEFLGKAGAIYQARAGFCFETQYLPYSTSYANFDLAKLNAGEIYQQETIFSFTNL